MFKSKVIFFIILILNFISLAYADEEVELLDGIVKYDGAYHDITSLNSDDIYTQSKYFFFTKGNTYTIFKTILKQDPKDENTYLHIEEHKFVYKILDVTNLENPSDFAIKAKLISYQVIYYSDEKVMFANHSLAYGQSNWKKGEAKDVTKSVNNIKALLRTVNISISKDKKNITVNTPTKSTSYSYLQDR